MEWNVVKPKPKRKAKKHHDEDDFEQFGGQHHGHLTAGPVKGAQHHVDPINNQASAIAQSDDVLDENEEVKIELVTHECAIAVQEARVAKKMTQEQLAKAINEKPSVVHEIEHGTAPYHPDQINRIEKALGVHIPRGRNKKKNKNKKK